MKNDERGNAVTGYEGPFGFAADDKEYSAFAVYFSFRVDFSSHFGRFFCIFFGVFGRQEEGEDAVLHGGGGVLEQYAA